ncbi:hypothetical protein K474DRAFT_203978 [Panus rudis PR-1116 ss-1]|nr:hypothetical protein K474DRAFT_203978 [Panus rudis PR-1116 ss-1]
MAKGHKRIYWNGSSAKKPALPCNDVDLHRIRHYMSVILFQTRQLDSRLEGTCLVPSGLLQSPDRRLNGMVAHARSHPKPFHASSSSRPRSTGSSHTHSHIMDLDVLADLGITDSESAASVLSETRVSVGISIAAATILVYDTILTFPQEIKCIWSRKWSVVTLLYVALRYGTLLDNILSAAYSVMTPSHVVVTAKPYPS